MLSLPIEVQLMILAQIVPNVPERYDLFFPRYTVRCGARLAAAFLAARTAASIPPPLSLVGASMAATYERGAIGKIPNPLVLRAALASALPAWRSALRSFPSLWRYIVVPVDEAMRGAEVLDAVQEAAKCAGEEPLSIIITRAPTENEEAGGGEAPRSCRYARCLGCVADMPSLGTLTLRNAHLGVGVDGRQNGGVETTASTALRSHPSLHCERLSAAVLREVLDLAIPSDGVACPRELHITECSLPRSPSLESYDSIFLRAIPADEDIGSSVERATRCRVVDIYDCPASSLRVRVRPAAPGLWMVPRLRHLSVSRCKAVLLAGMRDVVWARTNTRENLERFTRVLSDEQWIY